MGGGGWYAALRDQRAELRPLQNLRHQGSEPEYHLGPPRGRRRTQLPQYVNVVLDLAGPTVTRLRPSWPARRRWGYRAHNRQGSASTASRVGAVAKVKFATDRQNGADRERRFQVSNQTITGARERRNRLPRCDRCDRWRHDAALIKALQSCWKCPIRAVIARLTQTGHSAQRGRARGARPPDGVDQP